MTTREVKSKLQRYTALKMERQQLRERIREMEQELGPSTPGMDGMPHGSTTSDPTARKAEALGDIYELYEKKIAELAVECLRVEAMIDSLEPTERRLARFRYLEGMTWEEVCVAMGYSWRQVHRIHGRILERLAEK